MTETDRQTFVFHASWYEMIEELPAELRGPVTEAIIAYAFTGKMPDDPIIRAITALVRIAIDYDREKWNETKKKRSEAAKSRYAKAAKPESASSDDDKESPAATADTRESDDTCKSADTCKSDDTCVADYACSTADDELPKPPSKEKVIEYFKTKHFESDPRAFHAYYSATGWRMGSNRIRDWTSAACSWEIRQKTYDTNHTRHETKQNDRHARHRGVDTAAVGAEDYTGTI